MGLDMYLYASANVTDFRGNKTKARKFADELGLPPDNAGEGNYGYVEVKVQAGYWRKANAIHSWFVQNVQDGKDDCNEYWVTREDLVSLRSICKIVLSNATKAEELLTPTSGFFFGSQNIDEWYFKDLEHTIKVVDSALSCSEDIDFYYRSSW